MGRRFTGSQSLYCRVLSTIVCPSSPCKLLGQVRPSGQRHCLSTQGDPYKSTLLQTSLRSEHSGNSSSLSCKIEINKHLRDYCSKSSIFLQVLIPPLSIYINLLRWNDVPRTSRISSPKVAIFSQFWVYLNITQAKQMINLLLLSNFCPVMSFWQIQKDILTNYCLYTVCIRLVTRYGPRTNCQRKRLTWCMLASVRVAFLSMDLPSLFP